MLGEISALVTAVLWSGSSLVFASAIKRVGSVRVNIARLLLASVYLAITVALLRPDTRVTTGQVANLAVSGIIGLSLGDSFLFSAYQKIGARLSMLIMSTAPAIGAVLAYVFLGETLSSWGVVGIFVTLTGVGIVVLEKREGSGTIRHAIWTGVIFGVLGALGQGVGLIFAKAAFNEGQVNGFLATLIRIVAALIVLLPVSAAAGRLSGFTKAFAGDRRAAALTAAGSILGPFLGISLSLIAVAHTSVGVAATLMATVPIIMLPLTRIVYREQLGWRAVCGAFIAVAGVAILFLR